MHEMGGLRKKMPITAYTMLVGCLAIIGAGIPLSRFGLSGYYSKDAIIEQAWNYAHANRGAYWLLLALPVIGAAITAFYMFRLWFLTFAGQPRNHHRYDHAHESPRVMAWPLLVLAFLAISVGWKIPGTKYVSVSALLEQAQPVGTVPDQPGQLMANLTVPSEHESHTAVFVRNAGLSAFTAAALGVFAAALIYLWRTLNPAEIRHTFEPIYRLFWNKWYFDELYWAVFVTPAMFLARQIAAFDRGVIDWLLHAAAWTCRGVSKVFDIVLDRTVVDGSVNTFAHWTWDFGLLLRRLQTGSLRQYVLFIVMGTLLLFACVTSVRLLAFG
jgi:NADH-quinone oxidoreductase subunit L